MKNIKVTIGNQRDMAKEFISAWHKAEAGYFPEQTAEKIYFKDDRALFKVLTPKRCELLKYIHEHGETTILSLAKQLKRDYRNVYQDVKELNLFGLIIKDEESGKYLVPWSGILTEIPLSNHEEETEDNSQVKSIKR